MGREKRLEDSPACVCVIVSVLAYIGREMMQ